MQTGHTFLSADSFHHGVDLETEKRKGEHVYTFPECVDVVKMSNSGNVDVIVLDNEKVRAFKDGQSQVKLKKPKELLGTMMSVIQLRRGSRNLHFKTSHADDDFHTSRFPEERVQSRSSPQAAYRRKRNTGCKEDGRL